jgi:hypothetical protein
LFRARTSLLSESSLSESSFLSSCHVLMPPVYLTVTSR